MSNAKILPETPPSPSTPGKRKLFDCTPAPKVFSLCDLCSCWWNCMIFSEAALEPYPYLSNLPDHLQKPDKDITIQPSPTSSLSSALVPIYAKNWKFNKEKNDSKFIFSSLVNFNEEERKYMMAMKEEKHRLKLEILKMEKEAVQLRINNTKN